MKIRLYMVLFIFILTAACSRVEEQVVSALFKNYVSAQTALAHDDFSAAQQALLALTQESDEEIQALAREVAGSEDIKSIREKFQKLSEAVVKLPLPEGHVVAFCPMADGGKGASWVQAKGEIENPYFGTKMLNCGEITRTQ